MIVAGMKQVRLDGAPTNDDATKFVNSQTPYDMTFKDTFAIVKAYVFSDRNEPTPKGEINVDVLSPEVFAQDIEDSIYRICHSTILMKINNKTVLIDPVFSQRVSPVQWFGPKRFHSLPIDIEQLPNIDVVVISHDHYDHLDRNTIKSIHSKVSFFVTPLRVGKHLRKWGVPEEKIVELDWWKSAELESIKFTATPAQHFSGRGLLGGDETLWASWVIESTNKKLFFSGDTGYFDGFKQIGERLGPFDITMIESGAYSTMWDVVHMMPKQTLQAHIDLQGKVLLPIHNSSFDLALHDWFEPLETLYTLAAEYDINLITPKFGEKVFVDNPQNNMPWWRDVKGKKL